MRLSVMQTFHGIDFRLESSEHNSLVVCAKELRDITYQMVDAAECNAESEDAIKDIQHILCSVKRNLGGKPFWER